jgi:hypothetical protein
MHGLDIVIHELLPDTKSVGESMRALIDAHAKVYTDGDWSPYYDIPYDSEIPYLQKDWFRSVIANDPPASVPVAGLWFGLFEPVKAKGRDRETVADFYLSGAVQFKLDGGIDWAVRPKYFPEGRYANSQVLAAIYRAAYGTPGGLGVDAEQFLCLGYVAFVLKFILAEIDPALILSSAGPVGVAAGWDSGDPYYYGFITHDGFRVRDPKEAISGIRKHQEEFDTNLGNIDNVLANLDPNLRAALASLRGVPDTEPGAEADPRPPLGD